MAVDAGVEAAESGLTERLAAAGRRGATRDVLHLRVGGEGSAKIGACVTRLHVGGLSGGSGKTARTTETAETAAEESATAETAAETAAERKSPAAETAAERKSPTADAADAAEQTRVILLRHDTRRALACALIVHVGDEAAGSGGGLRVGGTGRRAAVGRRADTGARRLDATQVGGGVARLHQLGASRSLLDCIKMEKKS